MKIVTSLLAVLFPLGLLARPLRPLRPKPRTISSLTSRNNIGSWNTLGYAKSKASTCRSIFPGCLNRGLRVRSSTPLPYSDANNQDEGIPRKLNLGAGFSSNSIRHPLDLEYTRLLQNLPGINAFIRSVGGSVAEQILGLDNIGRGVQLGPNQAPNIYKLLTEACEILQMEPPALYIRQNPNPNAYTLAISGRQPLIVLHTSLVELLTEEELQAVIAHELGHLKCDHGVWLTIASLLSVGAARLLPIPVFTEQLETSLMRWVRSAELTCDRAALLVAQDRSVVMSMLMKLAGGCKSLDGQLNVDAFLEQARAYEEASNTPVGWYISNAESRQLSHPLPVMRAREIDQWSRSPEYRKLVGQIGSTGTTSER